MEYDRMEDGHVQIALTYPDTSFERPAYVPGSGVTAYLDDFPAPEGWTRS